MQLANQHLETPSSCFYCLLNGQVNCQDVVSPTQSCDAEANGKQERFIQQSVHLYFPQYNSDLSSLILICASVAYLLGAESLHVCVFVKRLWGR